jgi:hypothetical protein
MNITLTTVLVMVAIVLLGSAFWGSWAPLRREKPGENQQAQKLTIEDARMPPLIASVKFIALDGAHSLEPRDIVNVLQHWRTDDTCYATLTLRSGKELTGLLATAEIEALLAKGPTAA